MRESGLSSAQSESAADCARDASIGTLLNALLMEDEAARVNQLLAELLRRRRRHRDDVELERQLRALGDAMLLLGWWAFSDELTGLFNRRGFLRAGARMLERAARQSSAALLIYVDVDGLKHINDTLGHAAGDSLLERSAHLLRAVFGRDAVIGRLGGDEFAVLQRLTVTGRGVEVLRRISEAVEACNSATGPSPLSLSVGYAEFEPRRPVSVLTLLAQADGAMYGNKSRRLRRMECGPRSAALQDVEVNLWTQAEASNGPP